MCFRFTLGKGVGGRQLQLSQPPAYAPPVAPKPAALAAGPAASETSVVAPAQRESSVITIE